MVGLYGIDRPPGPAATISGRTFFPDSSGGQSTHAYFEPWEDAFVTQVNRERDAVRFPEDLDDSYKGVALLVGAKHVVPAIGLGFMAFLRLTAADEESRRWEARTRLLEIKVRLMAASPGG